MTELKNMETDAFSPLSRLLKFVYGSGDWGRASFNTLRQIFYAIFLTDVVRLDPRLASIAALIGIIWDAANDPIIGTISDNVRTRWGRRRPFLLLFSIPFALAFVMLWWAPPWKSQFLLMLHVTITYMVSDTLQTLVTVPYLALTPEISSEYDERTNLSTIRMFFNLLASLITAVAAPSILEAVVKAGFSQQQGYLSVAAIFGSLAIFPYLLIFFFIKEKIIELPPITQPMTLKEIFKILWRNIPFRYATGIYVLNWVAFDLVALMLPFFLLYWVASGDLLLKVNLAGIKISLESVVLGIMLLTATFALPIWNSLAKKYSKNTAYIIGLSFWVIVQILIFTIQPGQITFIIILAFLAGFGVSTGHVMPDAIFPDVIDWDELCTNSRHEGMYYGAINLIRKMSGAIAIFLALQLLGWFGYKAPPANAVLFTQAPTTLFAIRILTGPFSVLLLLSAIGVAWFYPLTRERQQKIYHTLIQRRKAQKENHPA